MRPCIVRGAEMTALARAAAQADLAWKRLAPPGLPAGTGRPNGGSRTGRRGSGAGEGTARQTGWPSARSFSSSSSASASGVVPTVRSVISGRSGAS